MKRAQVAGEMHEEVPCKQSNPRVRPRLRPCQRQSLLSFHLRHTKNERRRNERPNNDSHKTLQFLLVSRAYFHVFFTHELKVKCEKWVDVVCKTQMQKFFPLAVDSLCFPAGEAMGALLRLSSVRRLEFKLKYVNPPLARQMFEAIEKMPALESLDVDVYKASNFRGWSDGAFPTLPPSLVRFKGCETDVQHLVGRKHQCEEVVVSLYGNKVLYPLNARKVVIKFANIEDFKDYEGPLPLESTEILEFPFQVQPENYEPCLRSRELHLPRVLGGIMRVVGGRKAPFLLLKTRFEVSGFVNIAGMLAEIEACERHIDTLLAECEKREIRLLGLRLKLNIRLFESATCDDAFMEKFVQTLEQRFGSHIPRDAYEESEWIRVESEKRTDFSVRISWDHYCDSANNELYGNDFDDLEFDCGESREEFDQQRRENGYADSSDEGEEQADEDEEQ